MNIFIDLIKEYFCILKKYYLSNKIPDSWNVGSVGDIILVPGFSDSHLFLMKIGSALNAKGYKIHVLSGFDTTFKSLEYLIQILVEYIKNNDLHNVVLVSHSKGGIVSRYILENYPEASSRIKKVFTLCTPHKGTVFAMVPFLYLYEISTGSKIIKKLIGQTANLDKVINIYPKIDNSIVPNKNLILDGATNIKVDIIGHTRILLDDRTIKIILDEVGK